MFTPQEIQEKTFTKAVFGGYDMACVDDFLEPLTEDYIALYKENAVLKSKMKILVEKLEEYRGQEDAMKKAILAAQKTSDAMLAETEKKCAQMKAEAESSVRGKSEGAQQQIEAEEERVERARQAAQNFIDVIEKEVARHTELLNNLKMMNLAAKAPKKEAFDYDKAPAGPAPEPPAPPAPDTKSIADEIEKNVETIVGADDGGDLDKTRVARVGPNGKFADLQFGKNYDPNR
jgi:cell division initiation protein